METNQQQDEIEIDLLELFYVLMNKLGIIIVTTLFVAVLTGVVNLYFLKPTYTSKSSLYIVNKGTSLSSLSLSDLQLGTQLTKDYMVLAKSRPVTEQVIENLNLPMEHKDLLGIMTLSNPSDTRILEISVEYEDAYMAKLIVDEIANVSAKRISEIMDIKEPSIVETGVVATEKTGPNVKRNVLIAGLIAGFLCCGIITVRHLLDDTIKSPEDIEKYLGINTIGIIPLEMTKKEVQKDKKRKQRKQSKFKKQTKEER